MSLKPQVLAGIQKLGYETPTKIQEEVIREFLLGKNIIGQSQTGTGKTAAFIISLLERIDPKKPGVQALILAPTRELVTQIRDEIVALSTAMNVKSLPVYGGSPIFKQIDLLRRGQTIVVGTPGRVIDLIERRALKIAEVNYFVLDEVDRMLDMGFIDDIDFIWGNITNVQQALAFSATITPEMKNIVQKYLGVDYTYIKATDSITVDKIDHSFVDVPHIDKYDALKRFVTAHESKKTIVFVQMKRDTEVLSEKLLHDGLRAACLNGDMRQRERFKALRDFQEGKVDIFVVTDVAARGLNVKNIDLVVNFDVPNDPESYIHRIGRTGRAGAEGRAIMFVARDEQFLFKNIERRNKITIRQIDLAGNKVERVRSDDRRSSEVTSGGRGGYQGRSRGGFGGGSRGGSRGGYAPRAASAYGAPRENTRSWDAPREARTYENNDASSDYDNGPSRDGGGDRGGYRGGHDRGRGGSGGGYRGARGSNRGRGGQRDSF